MTELPDGFIDGENVSYDPGTAGDEGDVVEASEIVQPTQYDQGTIEPPADPETVEAFHVYSRDVRDTDLTYVQGAPIDTEAIRKWIVDKGYPVIAVDAELDADGASTTGLVSIRTPIVAPDIVVNIATDDEVTAEGLPAATNYVMNPEAGGASSYAAGGGTVTVTRLTGQNIAHPDGFTLTTAYRATHTANSGANTIVLNIDTSIPKSAGTTYTIQALFKGNAQATGKLARLMLWESGGVTAAEQSFTVETTLTGSWQLVTATGTIKRSDRTTLTLYTQRISPLSGDAIDVTAVMIENTTIRSSYVSGALGAGYTWNGTAHNSASTRQTNIPVTALVATSIDGVAGHTYSGTLTWTADAFLDTDIGSVDLKPLVNGVDQATDPLPLETSTQTISMQVDVSGIEDADTLGLSFAPVETNRNVTITSAAIIGTLTSDQPKGEEIPEVEWVTYAGVRDQVINPNLVDWGMTAEAAHVSQPDSDRLFAFWRWLEAHAIEVERITAPWNLRFPETAPDPPDLLVYAYGEPDAIPSDVIADFVYSELVTTDRDAFEAKWDSATQTTTILRKVRQEPDIDDYQYSGAMLWVPPITYATDTLTTAKDTARAYQVGRQLYGDILRVEVWQIGTSRHAYYLRYTGDGTTSGGQYLAADYTVIDTTSDGENLPPESTLITNEGSLVLGDRARSDKPNGTALGVAALTESTHGLAVGVRAHVDAAHSAAGAIGPDAESVADFALALRYDAIYIQQQNPDAFNPYSWIYLWDTSGYVGISSRNGVLHVGETAQPRIIYKGVLNVDPASIPADSAATTTISGIGGIQAGDSVIANPTGAVSAEITLVSVRVSASGTIAFRFRNLTASSFDPPALDWNVMVLR